MRVGVANLGVVGIRFAVPALVAIAIMVTTERIVGTAPVVSPVAPTGIVWHDRVFPTRQSLGRWLAARGSSYQEWARAHPALASPRPTTAGERAGLSGAAHATTLGLRLLLIGIAAVAAIFFASVLPYSVEKLRRAGPVRLRAGFSSRGHPVVVALGDAAVAFGGLRARTPARPTRRREQTESERIARRRHPWTQPVRVRVHRPSVFARRPALPAYRYWLRAVQRQYPDIAWSVGVGVLGAAVALIAAHFLR